MKKMRYLIIESRVTLNPNTNTAVLVISKKPVSYSPFWAQKANTMEAIQHCRNSTMGRHLSDSQYHRRLMRFLRRSIGDDFEMIKVQGVDLVTQ